MAITITAYSPVSSFKLTELFMRPVNPDIPDIQDRLEVSSNLAGNNVTTWIKADDTDWGAGSNDYHFNSSNYWGAYIEDAAFNISGSINEDIWLSATFFSGNKAKSTITTIETGSGSTRAADGYAPTLDVTEGANETFQVMPGVGFDRVTWTGANFDAGRFFDAMAAYNAGNTYMLDHMLEQEQYVFRGSSGMDAFWGGAKDDVLYGNGGSDYLFGADGNDQFFGGEGNDHLYGYADNDTFYLDAGNDAIDGGDNFDTIVLSKATRLDLQNGNSTGDAAGDTYVSIEAIRGSNYDDEITLDSNSAMSFSIFGRGGADRLGGSAGDDTLSGDSGNDRIWAGNGFDTMMGGTGNDVLDGGAGHDRVVLDHRGNLGATTGWTVNMATGEATTTFKSSSPSKPFKVETDKLISVETIDGSLGNDVFISVGQGTFNGNNGTDTLRLNTQTLTNTFTAGGVRSLDDTVDMQAGSASHQVTTRSGGMFGDFQTHTEYETFTSIEVLDANDGNDTVTGSTRGETILGGAGQDGINGLGGADKINGGLGTDILTGGEGGDAFVFNAAMSTANNRDTITDFYGPEDVFHLDNAIFTKLGNPGALNADFFKANANGTARDANDHIIYNTSTGVLSYDSNGNAAGGVTEICVLSNKAALAASDFLVI